MGITRFILILLILFGVAFWFSGGHITLPNNMPSTEQVISKLPTPTTINNTSLQKFHRFVFLKEAVNAKLARKDYVPLAQIPLTLQQAVIAVEDNRFYQHSGFDINGIMRAVLTNMQKGTVVEGGSTISQQLIKNLFLTQNQTWERKFEELILAVILEQQFTKEEILTMYLNTIYFGSGAYGIKQAAAVYFDKLPHQLNLAESALLAGIPNAPSVYSPYENLSAAKSRQAVVLSVMVQNGLIGPNTAQQAKNSPLQLAK